jgi:hypothetical protein
VLKESGVSVWMGFMWLRIGAVAGSENSNGPQRSVNGREFVDWLRVYQLLKNHSAS